MPKPALLTSEKISEFCRLRLTTAFETDELTAISRYLADLLALMTVPPYRGRMIDWAQVALATNIDRARLQSAKQRLQPVFDAVTRAVAMQDATSKPGAVAKAIPSTDTPPTRRPGRAKPSSAIAADAAAMKKRGPKPRPIIEFPEPLWTEWEEPETLSKALILHMRRHGDSVRHLGLEPIAVALERRIPIAEKGSKVAPRAARPRDPQHGFEEPPVVAAAAPGVCRFAQAMRFQLRPLGVRQNKSIHQKLESQTSQIENPQSEQALDNLTPAAVYSGRSQTILLERERIKRQTIENSRLQHRNADA